MDYSPDGLLGYTVDEPEAVAYRLEDAFAAVHRGANFLDCLSLSEGEAALWASRCARS
ncbi:hypothetical protein [Streptomyces sp. NPDC006463]|uniref:hypothetical protein n=1 Tax=Streptomyces sp. NPDC006463 TaxID=3364746 RepID=UPI0036CB8794